MGIRYDNRNQTTNNEDVYEDLRDSRDSNTVKHYTTPRIPHLTKEILEAGLSTLRRCIFVVAYRLV